MSATASVAGVAAAIGWPLSPQNLMNALSEGAQFGGLMGVFLGLMLLMVGKDHRQLCTRVGIALIAAYVFVVQMHVTAGMAAV